MSRNTAEVELDSYRLAKYAVPVPCYICEQPNTFDAELCRHCLAPLALAHQLAEQKATPSMIATIGSSGVGKTVYLGVLMDMLSRRSDHMQALARGSFSINLQQKTLSALSRNEFPDKTPTEPDRWNWVHCQLRSEKHKPIELVMPDMAGEALMEEVDHPSTFTVIHSFLSKCSGALVLIDAMELYSGTSDQDYFTMKLLSYLSELIDDPKRGWAKRPIAIVFSKADQCDEAFDDPAAFAQRRAAGLLRHCEERFENYKFFAASVAGNCIYRETTLEGRIQVPLRVEPRGVAEPFEWMVGQVRGKGR